MKRNIFVSIFLSYALIVLLIFINYITTPDNWWSINTTYAILWIPLSSYLKNSKNIFLYSIFGSLLTIIYLSIINFIQTPYYPWVLYTLAPLIIWPVLMYFKKYLNSVKFSFIIILLISLYYFSLNNFLIPSSYPWVVYIFFTLMWWPISLFFSKRKMWFGLSLGGSINMIIFFIVINYISSPYSIWFVYPVFAIMWWPLSMYFFHYKMKKISIK
jgi:hypothetical protein